MNASNPTRPAPRASAQATVQLDTDRVLVTEWRFAPGTETGWHTHALDYVVVPLTHGTLTVETRGAAPAPNPLTPGASYTRAAGVEHNVANDTSAEIAFVEIEIKDR
ncbi:cupin domain-containing protein [Micrococcales bacterium 31B]|nr:cupin domain-containing protein [Micrococcales bacterium 31B]